MSLSSSQVTLRSSPSFTMYALDDAPLAVVVVPANSINWDLPMLRRPAGQWTTGLFHCCDHIVFNCVISFFCPCVAVAQLFVRMGMPRYWGMVLLLAWAWLTMVAAAVLFIVPLPLPNEGESVVRERHLTGLVLPVGALWGGTALAVVVIRRNIRAAFNIPIPATQCSDWVVACCCPSCALAQAATHLQIYTPNVWSLNRPDVLPAFVGS